MSSRGAGSNCLFILAGSFGPIQSHNQSLSLSLSLSFSPVYSVFGLWRWKPRLFSKTNKYQISGCWRNCSVGGYDVDGEGSFKLHTYAQTVVHCVLRCCLFLLLAGSSNAAVLQAW